MRDPGSSCDTHYPLRLLILIHSSPSQPVFLLVPGLWCRPEWNVDSGDKNEAVQYRHIVVFRLSDLAGRGGGGGGGACAAFG